MTDDGRPAPPGWYPTPGGGQRYWDGSQWLDLPEPALDGPLGAAKTASDAKPAVERRKLWIAVVVAVLVLASVTVGAVVVKRSNDARAASEVAAEEALRSSEARAAEEAAMVAQQEEAARREAEAAAERVQRTVMVAEVEESVKKMAETHAADGRLDGPILSVTCSPVDGGSVDELDQVTTVFECFAANRDNGDGTQNGYRYNATMNWTTGRYTYGLGAP